MGGCVRRYGDRVGRKTINRGPGSERKANKRE
ncbi:hypothetical protein CCACVL1_29992 [Corchorus capsularis]|uniref:Uncharacterized protein n=1 Tax=Corchorus capsularis TaxID=210143 RepID=A0A1R3FZ66_COCAP|nr:hypothetical protein CCACVL1_29992 [Corchorus capsularis]